MVALFLWHRLARCSSSAVGGTIRARWFVYFKGKEGSIRPIRSRVRYGENAKTPRRKDAKKTTELKQDWLAESGLFAGGREKRFHLSAFALLRRCVHSGANYPSVFDLVLTHTMKVIPPNGKGGHAGPIASRCIRADLPAPPEASRSATLMACSCASRMYHAQNEA